MKAWIQAIMISNESPELAFKSVHLWGFLIISFSQQIKTKTEQSLSGFQSVYGLKLEKCVCACVGS